MLGGTVEGVVTQAHSGDPPGTLRQVLALLVALVGIGVAMPAHADGRICLDNDVLTFGNRFVGTTTSVNVAVTNCGDQSWSFTDVSVHPATGPAFHITTTCATGLAMPPGAGCMASVQFAPLVTGQTSGGLWLRNSTSNLDELLTYYGRGIDAQAGTASLTFIPAIAAFGPQLLNTQSPALVLEVHNDGPASLTPARFVLNGPAVYDYSGVFDTCQVGTAIPAGQGCTMALYFLPQAAGTRLANLVIDAPQLASLAILPISGIGAILLPPPTVAVIEFYNESLDHYFISTNPQEIGDLDHGVHPGWARTGLTFNAYNAAIVGFGPVCRFYIPPQHGDSHFFSADAVVECANVLAKIQTDPNYSGYFYETPNAFYIGLPDMAAGVCRTGTVSVYRLWNNHADSNHRYTTDPAVKAQMIAKGYLPEGYGPDSVVMCAPQ
jgi:hypothetical protein